MVCFLADASPSSFASGVRLSSSMWRVVPSEILIYATSPSYSQLYSSVANSGRWKLIIHDLYSLRLQTLKTDFESPSGPISRVPNFSSASELEPEASDEEDEKSRKLKAKLRDQGRKLPKLVDTLGLCYLGMLLLKLPVSLGDIYRYVDLTSVLENDTERGVKLTERTQLGYNRRTHFCESHPAYTERG